jgi:uncharacterized protein YunC (DUF1805 family)
MPFAGFAMGRLRAAFCLMLRPSDRLADGIISNANAAAEALGARPGRSCREAVEALIQNDTRRPE